MAGMVSTHIEPTPAQGAAFLTNAPAGAVVMLNLLRFRERADYGRTPRLAPNDGECSGIDAYAAYAEHAMPLLRAAGGEVLFQGRAEAFIIGPEGEGWDMVILVRYPSAAAFMKFATDPAYLAGVGHRTAALSDSRLLPLSELKTGPLSA